MFFGNNSCMWIILIIIVLCCCGNGNNHSCFRSGFNGVGFSGGCGNGCCD